MEIIQIVTIGIVASILYIILKDLNESIAFFLLLITAIIIFLAIIQRISIIFEMIESLGEKANIEDVYLQTILKIIGIAYIAELGASITRDAGLGSVAAKIELAGKIFILVLAVPIITAVIEAILTFLPTS
ncbi:MAG TPA: stage III sporulation protein AD [Virgibacillus sp.]|nr:stage III sporulation protein AD [Virgibacillus sp.]